MTKYAFVKKTSETECVVITPKMIAYAVVDKIAGGLLNGMKAAERLAKCASSAVKKAAEYVGLLMFAFCQFIVADEMMDEVEREVARAKRIAAKQSPELAQELDALDDAVKNLKYDRNFERLFFKLIAAICIVTAAAVLIVGN